MIRVHVICEGQTEEEFVNNLLRDPLAAKGVALYPSLIGRPRRKGGNLRTQRLLNDIHLRLSSDSKAYCTTFFDYYGLPKDFPGKQEASSQPTSELKAQSIREGVREIVERELGPDVSRRLIPYVQMHEFEGLLFSAPEVFAASIGHSEKSARLSAIRNEFSSPEDINDSTKTAPSKRIENLIRGYEKPIMGTIGAMDIGLTTLRRECRLFSAWLEELERLGR